MVIVVATFAFVLAVVVGSYWLLVVRPEDQSRHALKQRMAVTSRARAIRTGLLKEAERLSHVGILERLLARSGTIVDPLRRSLHEAGMTTSVGTILLASGCLALAGFLIVMHLTQYALIGLLVGAVAAAAPFWVIRFRRQRRLVKFEEQFPEAIDLIARALRAGHAFTTGLSMVAEETPEPVAGEFRTLYEQQNYGLPMAEALREFAQRIPVLDAQFFATAVLTQREAGGNLSEVLDNLGSVIRERFKVKRQVRVISAHGRMTGWILAGLPPALAVAFMILAPKHIKTLIGDPLGIRMIETAIVLQVVGSYIISRIVKIEY